MEWQLRHPLFQAIQPGRNVKTFYSTQKTTATRVLGDPSVLQPPAVSTIMVATGKARPELIHYVQLPLHLWIPDYFYPDLVSHTPCPVDGCTAGTQRRRWHSGGPRLIHGVHHAVQYEAASGRMRLHPVHGDMIKKAVALLDNQADRRLEHSFIKRAEERAAKDLDAVIPYVPVSPMTQPFSLFEEQSLREMVRTCSNPKTGVVKWQKLTTRWMCFYQASVEANAHTRLTPRSDEHLRSRWSVLKRRDKHATKEEPVEAAAVDGKEEMEEEKEKAEDAQQDDDVGQDDDAESATAGMEESTAMETEQHTPAPPSQSPSTSVTPFYILGRWLTPRQAPSPPSLPPLPPLPVTPSSSSSWSSSSSILTTTVPDGPTVEPQQQQRKKWHWPEPEAQRFRELAAKSGYKWSYDEFCAQWPLELFDHVAEARFDNKNKTELKKLRTGSSTNRKRTRLAVDEDSSSSSKGARKVKQGRPHRTAKLA